MINQCRFICFLLVIFLLEGSNSLIAQEALGKINCICIDAGHGGSDPGKVGCNDALEKTSTCLLC